MIAKPFNDHVKFATDLMINPSSPKGGLYQPPIGFRPGAQNPTAKG